MRAIETLSEDVLIVDSTEGISLSHPSAIRSPTEHFLGHYLFMGIRIQVIDMIHK